MELFPGKIKVKKQQQQQQKYNSLLDPGFYFLFHYQHYFINGLFSLPLSKQLSK